MFVYRNRLLFGAIKNIIKTIFKTLYAFLGLFNLQLTSLVCLIGVILWITGVFAGVPAILTAFWIMLALSVVWAGFLTVSKIKKTGKRKTEKRDAFSYADVSDVHASQPEPPVQNVGQQERYESVSQEETTVKEEKEFAATREIYPKYYRVKQNAKYVFAEYSDRYELFFDNGSTLTKIRTDYKR